MITNSKYNNLTLSDIFISRLVNTFDKDDTEAIALTGSYARGEATSYSDIDLKVFVSESSARAGENLYFYLDDYLLNVVVRTISQYRERLSVPQEAVFVVPSLREACILLDKQGVFYQLQQEAVAWLWEPLQGTANQYAGEVLVKHAEYIHKILRAFLVNDIYALAEMVAGILAAVTEAVIVQRGVLAKSGNSFYMQAEESVGIDTAWSRYHRYIVDIDNVDLKVSLEGKGVAALKLYMQTFQLLEPALMSADRKTIQQTISLIEQVLPQLPKFDKLGS